MQTRSISNHYSLSLFPQLFDATQIIEACILMVAKWLLLSEGHLDLNMFPGFMFASLRARYWRLRTWTIHCHSTYCFHNRNFISHVHKKGLLSRLLERDNGFLKSVSSSQDWHIQHIHHHHHHKEFCVRNFTH
jgi:hypothetical protein